MKTYTYTIHIEPSDGDYVVSVPALPGCFTQGDTYEEALEMGRECIAGFLEALVKAGQPIPVEEPRPSPGCFGCLAAVTRHSMSWLPSVTPRQAVAALSRDTLAPSSRRRTRTASTM